MRGILVIATLPLFLITPIKASAQYVFQGYIDIFSDPGFTSGNFVDKGPALAIVYIAHLGTRGSTACQFRLQAGPGFGCTWVGESSDWLVIGDTHSGISVAYGSCMSGTIELVTIKYFCYGTTPDCTFLQIVPDPNAISGTIEVVDCENARHVGYGGYAIVNDTGTCGVGPVQSTSWGRIKSLYR